MKSLKSLLAILLVALVLTGCQGKEKRNQKETKTVSFGVLATLTGEYSRYGQAMKWGIDIAVDDLNKSNDTLKINAKYQDDKFQFKEAIEGFNYFKQKNMPIIFGPAGSGISKLLAPRADQAKIVLLSSISTADSLKYAGDYYFRNVSPNSDQAITIIDFIRNDLKYNKVGVLYENNEYGLNMQNVFGNRFSNPNEEIVFNEPYEENQTNFRNLIAKIKNKNCDIIFIPGTTKGIALLVKQLREQGVKSEVITGDGGYGWEITDIAGKNANGLYCTLMTIEDTTTVAYQDFSEKFKKEYKTTPDVYSVYSYDAVGMVYACVLNILQRAEPVTGENIKNELYKLKYDGRCGHYEFDEYGEVSKPFGLFQLVDGQYIRVK